jgi:hypothetical protein
VELAPTHPPIPYCCLRNFRGQAPTWSCLKRLPSCSTNTGTSTYCSTGAGTSTSASPSRSASASANASTSANINTSTNANTRARTSVSEIIMEGYFVSKCRLK